MFKKILVAFMALHMELAYSQTISFWASTNFFYPVFSDPVQGCDYMYSDFYWGSSGYRPDRSKYETPTTFLCGIEHSDLTTFGTITHVTASCENGTSYNFSTRSCQMAGQKGAGQDPLVCPATTPSGVVGNPINALIGNKFQAEYDFSVGGYNPLTLYHYYNSSDQKWTHSYSDHLNIGDDSIAIVRSDGRETIYAKNADSYTSDSDFGTLEARTDGWTYKASDGGRMEFDLSGRLVETYTVEGGSQFLTYESAAPYYVVTVKNGLGSEVKITETPRHEPIAISSSGVSVGFTYGDSLDSVETTENGVTTTRRYEYTRVTSVRNLLAAVIDERGVKFASWSYDYMGRPLSSEHSDGAQKTSVSYLDGASIVTNALGKNVTYRYQNMHGVNRIVSIEGEPSPNCPASNSSYTYNDRGQVLTKTDAKGLITTYSYNDRGLEVSRVEASGTPLARTTITEWDPSRFLKTKVLEPTRSTLYTYDAQGRPLSQQTTPN